MIGNVFKTNKKIKNYFDGLLLGDGCIIKSGSLSGQYIFSQKIDHIDWVNKQIDFFIKYGIEYRTYNRPAGKLIVNGKSYVRNKHISLHTITYRNLLSERNRWYPNGKKRVPRDIDLKDPQLLANWYMGDGSATKCNSRRYRICLHTEGFIKKDVIWLKNQFKKVLNIDVKINSVKNYHTIEIKYWHGQKFLNLIRAFICPSFNYKIPKEAHLVPKCLICDIKIKNKKANAKFCKKHTREAKLKQDRGYYLIRKNAKESR